MHRAPFSTFAAAFVFAASPALADSVLAQSTFDNDLDGWTSNHSEDISWSAGGGNPGGRVLFTDSVSNGTFIIAPAKFRTGAVDLKALNGKAYITFQHEIVQNGGTGLEKYEVDLIGPSGTAQYIGGTPLDALNKWQTVAVPLVQGDWTVSGGKWLNILNDVETLEIRIELINGSPDTEAVDNVKIVSHPKGFAPR